MASWRQHWNALPSFVFFLHIIFHFVKAIIWGRVISSKTRIGYPFKHGCQVSNKANFKDVRSHSFKTSTRKTWTQGLFLFFFVIIFNFAVFHAVDVFHKIMSLFLTVCRSLSSFASSRSSTKGCCDLSLGWPCPDRSPTFTHTPEHCFIHGDFSHWKHKICNRTLAAWFSLVS